MYEYSVLRSNNIETMDKMAPIMITENEDDDIIPLISTKTIISKKSPYAMCKYAFVCTYFHNTINIVHM